MSIKQHQLRKRVNKRFQAAYDSHGYLSLCSIINSNLMKKRKQKNAITPKKIYLFQKYEENRIHIKLLPQQLNISIYKKASNS
ncbi:hypothetical protein UB38_08395 [Photobacterium iliopiscarium]|uniref:Uncharacterized protein n=1 Tax=Photobacterium iliopiscarium TaxID=56192 RepID=A0A2T3MI25_9GAMM|nr:hypothetical protein UB38_08395 [Photobacterium iliopiscarium]PST99189.1 hypothetical protein C9I85_11605 [Photobacterium iliopiscarium]PSV94025.1 hypothetical protein C9I88_15490 [Photobacterium iliopiscarium]